MTHGVTQGERITSLEVKVEALTRAFEARNGKTDIHLDELGDKLDDLLALRNKGVGVFWLISALVGTGIVGVLFQFMTWLRPH